MNADESKAISRRVIGCALSVGNNPGAGFLERVYQNAMAVEMREQRLQFKKQQTLRVGYKGVEVGDYVADFVVDDRLVVEVKAVSTLTSSHEAQLMNYLRALASTVGILLNFGTLKIGIRRRVCRYNDEATF